MTEESVGIPRVALKGYMLQRSQQMNVKHFYKGAHSFSKNKNKLLSGVFDS